VKNQGTLIYLGVGSNVNAQANIASGIQELEEALDAVQLSPAYRTRAVGFEGEDFINLVVECRTGMQPLELKAWLNALEDRHGRTREVPKFSDRTLDIDILLYGDLWARLPGLEIPRPEIETFAHVLRPLADLAPDLIHPSRREPLAGMWRDFPDKPSMQQVDPGQSLRDFRDDD
jgi:2-amino-4-hydroxy-6-hydroxymethyldihydropteridine diphosphokinase